MSASSLKQKKKVYLKFILGLILILILIYSGISIYIASALTVQEPSPLKLEKNEIGIGGENVEFKTSDGLTLSGWFFEGTNGKVIVFVHGAGNQNRLNEVYGTPAISKYFYEKGYSILLFDMRGTGESDSSRISFGHYEAEDVAASFKYVLQRGYSSNQIGIISDSMGAISTVMASHELIDIGAVVLDSPASELRSVISGILSNERKIPSFLHPGIYSAAKILYKIDVDKVKPIEKIEAFKNTPILFLHGEADNIIPSYHSQLLSNKLERSKRIIYPGIKHVEIYNTYPDKYLQTVEEFFDSNL